MRARITAFSAGLLLSASLAQSQEALRFETVTLLSETNATFINAEIADTDATRSKGLMFRHRLPEGQGMLFIFEPPRPVSMWMKNTNMSLDMLFIREDGSIAGIAEKTTPQSLDTISVDEPVRGVLELPGGAAQTYGLKLNDTVVHRSFKNNIN